MIKKKREKRRLQYVRQLVGVCCCGIFLPGNNIRPESKEIIIITVIITIIIMILYIYICNLFFDSI